MSNTLILCMDKRYKKSGEPMIIWNNITLEKKTEDKDLLLKITNIINWEYFSGILLEKLQPKKCAKKSGATAYHPLLLFKMCILQGIYGLSDEQVEFQVIDRFTFKRFLGLGDGDKVPDAKTIWLFREKLTRTQLMNELFDKFHEFIAENGYTLKGGRIIDATFVETPRQRNTRSENETIKEGKVPEGWADNPNKLSQKDLDASWTKKNDQNYYGYKNHVKIDSETKLILNYEVTTAKVHDSQALSKLLTPDDMGKSLYADSAYTGEVQEKIIDDNKMINEVCEKGYRNNPLTPEQKKLNTEKSRIRVRVEHVFGAQEQIAGRHFIRTIGSLRARTMIGIKNLIYNIFRFSCLKRQETKSSPA